MSASKISILSGLTLILIIVIGLGAYILYNGSNSQWTAIQPTSTPSPTAIPPVWKDTPLVYKPFQSIFPNTTPDSKKQDIYGSGISLNTDTRWVMDVQVEPLGQDVGYASTGIALIGHNENGNIQSFQLVYQMGNWAMGYSPSGAESGAHYWEILPDLTSPIQHFELLISSGGKNLTLKNDAGFQVNRTVNENFFDGAQSIVAEAQIGAQTQITVSTFIIQQLQYDQTAALPNLPTPTAPANNDTEYVFHVAVNGKDSNPGTAELPFGSIERARDAIRIINPTMDRPIVVYVHGGVYPISETIQFETMDSGQNGFNITYRAAEGEIPILSGGINVNNWEQVPDSPLWKTTLTDVKDFRQMYVNGIRAQRAVSQEPMLGLGWAAGDFSDRDGIVIASSSLPDFSRPQDLELHWVYEWKDMRLLVKSMEINPDGTKTISLKQPYFSYALWMEIRGNLSIPMYNVPFYVENAFELLDNPGEWYYNPDTHELFYLPQEGENMPTAEVIIPQTQNLVEITGQAVGREVHNIAFEGLTFAYAGWTRASKIGTFGWQAQQLITKSGWNSYDQAKTPAHVQVNSAYNIRFEGCRFEHLGAAGLDLNNNVFQTTVQGNLFHDISDGAIIVGHWDHAYISAPSIQAAPYDNLIANNLIHNVGVEYWGAPAITAYYVNHLRVLHNEISNIPYTGISIGWGWSSTPDSTTSHDNLVANNLITDLLQIARDGGGVYTLGQQTGTVIEENVVRRAKTEYAACLFPDEGSNLMLIKNNVCDSMPQWLHIWTASIHDIQIINSFTNVEIMNNNGVNIQIENTVHINDQEWTPEAQSIIDNAGLEPTYLHLRNWLPTKFCAPQVGCR